jgi:hypothetical protein
MQYVANQDFDIEVKFDRPLSRKTQAVGVLAQQDSSNYLRFNFQSDTGATTLNVVNTVNGNSLVVYSTPVVITGASYLRVNRAGDIWNVQYSIDGVNWTFATTYTRSLVLSQIGPFVGNTGTDPAHVNVIDYFLNLNDDGEDVDAPIQLNVTQTGLGTVTRQPDKTAYSCNETVTLTAAPAADWSFAGWGGALTGSELVKTISLVKSENVTATFANSTAYTLNVDVVSNGDGVGGTVTRAPNTPTYLYGTEVQLTATPTPGWSFVGWSGDWTSTDPVTTVPVTSNMDVTATFEQDAYTVEALIIAEGVGLGGTITIDPVQPTYLYGETVTITVAPTLGWTFAGWADGSTGVSGNELVTTLTLSEDVIAIARLVQNQYDLAINLVHNGEPGDEGGVVTKNPDQATFGHGQVVTVIAVVEPGWLFAGWAGDLSGDDLTGSLEMTGDRAITATFTQQHYTVTVDIDSPDDVVRGRVELSPAKPYYLYNDIVTLVPVADPGYEFALWSGDLTGSDEPAVLAIDRNYNVTAHFVVDTTPIEISNASVEVMPGGTLATVTWATDVPGTSRVDYGETALYELGTEVKDEVNLVTTHTVLLSGLTADTFYHLQITSEDAQGNVVQSEDMTFTTSNSSGIFSDDFAACEVDDRWTWVDPLNDSTREATGRQLSITVPGTAPHTLWTTGIGVPRLMQPTNDDDFTVEIKFDSILSDVGGAQGIVIEQDANTFLRLEFYRRAETDVRVYAAGFRNPDATPNQFANQSLVGQPTEALYMRIVRAGNTWQQFYSLDGENWTLNKEFEFDMAVKRVGFYAGNSKFARFPLPTNTVVVDYFFNTAAPITPEDSRYAINVAVEGSGTVTRAPNRGYYCGQEVTLTATPANGWVFLGWGGDISGTGLVHTLTVRDDMNVMAQFSSDGFKLVVPLILR